MTHTQTQGADGAGTKTGDAMILLPLDDPNRPLNDSGLPSAMIWAGGEAYDDLTAINGGRQLDLDSCSLAVGIYRAMTEAHAKEIATLSPAPAATPGVPDSLREAFAAATDSPVFVHDFADPAVSSAPGCQDISLSFVTPDHITAAFMGNGLAGTIDQARKDAVALAAAWNHVRALIAAQPAGQAGDAGAAETGWPASYQETFNAIQAATKIQGGMISVSVRDFYRALSYPDPAALEANGAGDLAERLRREIGEIRTMAADPENKAAFCELTVVADNLEALLPAADQEGAR